MRSSPSKPNNLTRAVIAPLAWRARTGARYLAVLLVAVLAVSISTATASAVAPQRVALKILVVTNSTVPNSHNADAIATQLQREGVPYTSVDAGDPNRPRIDKAFLEDEASGTGNYQGVVLVSRAGVGLSAAEMDALAAYEVRYGVRQINGYDFPTDAKGFGTNQASVPGDGAQITVSPAGAAAGFGYLRGQLTVDDFDPAVAESFAYFAPLATDLPAGASADALLTIQKDNVTGVLAGAYSEGGREELTFTAAFNPYQQWWNAVAHGAVTWLTRGLHLGYQRNYFAVQVDDVFLPDSRWSADGNCTPGDNCVDPNVTTPDIRMTAADVDKLVDWQNAHNFKLDMVFNAYGTQVQAGQPADALTARFLERQAEFPWINHTWSHPYLGCIQVAPTVQTDTWHCATKPGEGPLQDEEVPQQEQGGIYWASQQFLYDQVQKNIAWAKDNKLTDFDPTELVTGEHSGLRSLPQQADDNPFLAPALASNGISVLASDASRENAVRSVGSAVTVPRHPMNIFYNAGTYRDLMDEYNWIYNSSADGGSGICEQFPETTTCIKPLAAASEAEAKASFDSYLLPMEVRNALRFVLTNDPRPFYAHQSNLTEAGLLYPVVEGILAHYRSTVDESSAPLLRLDLTEQARVLRRMDAWNSVKDGVTAYVDAQGVHLTGTNGQEVPLTVPSGSSAAAAGFEQYAGELSGWLTTSGTVAVPPVQGGGYLPAPAATVPGAPLIGQVTAGNASATVTWSASSSDGGSPVTGYRVDAFTSASGTPAATVTAPAGATSAQVDKLTNGTAYTFTVTAANALGDGPASERSASVTPVAVSDAPVIGTASAGDASATVSWSAPASDGGSPLTGYVVLAHPAGGGDVLQTQAAAGATSTQVPGLTNGTTYTFTVVAVNGAGSSPESASSNAVTPAAVVPPATVPGAPRNVSAVAGSASATVTWTSPAADGGSPVTGYLVRAYAAGSTEPATSVATGADSTTVSVPGLANGTAYAFDVVAVNAAGEGPASARSSSVTPSAPAAAPGAPAAPQATAGNARVTASWTAPASDGGSPLTGYVVTAYTGTGTTPASSVTTGAGTTTADVTGLKNGTAYTLTVRAVNAAGSSPESARSASVTPLAPASVPSAPAAPTATAGNTSATVTWKAPANNGGSALTGYVVAAYKGTATTPVSTLSVGPAATTALVTGLTNGTAYRFTVRAVNVVGPSAESAKSSAVTPKVVKTVPSAPAMGSAKAGPLAATVTWAPPATDGGSPVTGYVVTVTPSTGKAITKTAGAKVTSLTVTGLTAGKSYTFSVSARNAVGTGPKSASSDPVVVGKRTVPGAPTIGTAKAVAGGATVTWAAPASDGGARITGYVVTVYPAGGKASTKKASAGSKSLRVTGLSKTKTYTFTVAATNQAGTSPASARSNAVRPR